MKVTGSATMFPVSDLDASLRFFVEVLGFSEDFRFGKYAGIKKGECCIHLSAFGNPNTGKPGSACIYIFCDEVDQFYREITELGAVTDGPPKDYEYGMRDFIARDLDRNQISFGTPTGGA
ncbi:MAG: VOC family protein [Phycisphaerales bacterium]|nr:VOC family protein [Phycisphaerales bacterium]